MWSLLEISPGFLSTKQNKLDLYSSLWTKASPKQQQCPSNNYCFYYSIKQSWMCPFIVFPPSGVLIPYKAHHFSLFSNPYPIIWTGFSDDNKPDLYMINTYCSLGFAIFKWYTALVVMKASFVSVTHFQNTTLSWISTCFNLDFSSRLKIWITVDGSVSPFALRAIMFCWGCMRAESALFGFLETRALVSKLNTTNYCSPAGVVSLTVMYLSDSKLVTPNL